MRFPRWSRTKTLIAASVVLGLLAISALVAPTLFVVDRGGQVFNVKAYGATGNGTTDDSTAVQAAYNACQQAGGGTVLFPYGTFRIAATVQDSQSNYCDTLGVSPQGSKVIIDTALGFNVNKIIKVSNVDGFIGGKIANLWFDCNSPHNNIALQMTDSVAASPALINVYFHGCEAGFEWINSTQWNERISAWHVTGNDNTHLFWFHQVAGDVNNSFAYAWFGNIHANLNAGQDVYFADGGANVYSGHFDAQGNSSGTVGSPAYWFNESGTGNSFWGEFFLWVEGGNYYAFNCVGSGNSCNGSADLRLINSTAQATTGSNTSFDQRSNRSNLMGSLTTTAATSDSLTAPNITAFSHCSPTPTNSSAASMTGVYVSGIAAGSLTLNHPATAGATFDVYCTVAF